MIVNQNISVKGAECVETSELNKQFCSPTFCYKMPTRFQSWENYKDVGLGVDHFYYFPSIMSADCSVWCDEKQEYVQIGEGVVIKLGNKFVWFEPCVTEVDDNYYEVKGEFELSFPYFANLKLKVKA